MSWLRLDMKHHQRLSGRVFLPPEGLNLQCLNTDLDWGTVLSTNRKMAFSDGSWMRFLIIHMNWATVMSEGTRYFLLSMSTICDPDTFSTITWQKHRHHNKKGLLHTTADITLCPLTGTLSGYLLRILADSMLRCSVEHRATFVLIRFGMKTEEKSSNVLLCGRHGLRFVTETHRRSETNCGNAATPSKLKSSLQSLEPYSCQV